MEALSDVKRGQNLEAEAEAFWRLRPRLTAKAKKI